MALTVALVALHGQPLSAGARFMYITTAILALHLNVPGVIPAFQKIRFLHVLPPWRAVV